MLLSSLWFERKEARALACELGLKGIGLHWILLDLNNEQLTEITKLTLVTTIYLNSCLQHFLFHYSIYFSTFGGIEDNFLLFLSHKH